MTSPFESDHPRAASDPIADDASGQSPEHIGPYHILGVLGEGGMGVVYAAEQKEPIQRRVALKVIKPGMDSRAVLARFEAERQALAMMSHTNIARVLDAGTTDRGQPYFVMEFVRGTPLTVYCDKNRLGLRERLDLFQQVCRGVQHAHHKGVIHRDLKPTNILVEMQDQRPVAKIIDFGLARATDFKLSARTVFTEQGQILGTPEYMSPEQAEMSGTDIDTRADVYALGVLLYELLTGELPFSARQLRQAGVLEIQRVIREETPSKPSTRITTLTAEADDAARQRSLSTVALVRAIRGDLDWITMKALEKDRQRRFQTAEELGADIRRYLNHEPVMAGPPTMSYRMWKLVKRHRWPFAMAAAVLVTLVGGVIASTCLWLRADRAESDERSARLEAEQSARDALSAKQRYDRLADLVRLDKLEQDMEDLWPEAPERVEAMSLWLASLDALGTRLPAHKTRLDELGARATPVLRGGVVTGFRLASDEDQFVHDSLTRLVQKHEAMLAPGGSKMIVEEAREWASKIRRESIDRHMETWRRAVAEIAEERRYHSCLQQPQLGLVPLGRDPASGLQEFAHVRSGRVPERGNDGRLILAEDACLVFVLIPPAECDIGAQNEDLFGLHYDPQALPAEHYQRVPAGNARLPTVVLEAFFLSKTEMSCGQWQALSGGANPSAYEGPSTALPVVNVSWHDCLQLLNRHGLLLPTEAQWEYAARAGTSTPFWTGQDLESLAEGGPAANVADRTALATGVQWPGFDRQFTDGHVGPAPVATLRPNGFGLHHVMGNVFEWCRDRYALYDDAPFKVGEGEREIGVTAFDGRITRGGAFNRTLVDARVSRRIQFDAQQRAMNIGLRPVRRITK